MYSDFIFIIIKLFEYTIILTSEAVRLEILKDTGLAADVNLRLWIIHRSTKADTARVGSHNLLMV